MALSFLKTIEKPDDLRKIECLLSHITANKKLCKKNTIKTQTSCLHISFFIQIFFVTLDRKATTLCRRVFRTIGWCSGNDLETVLFAMLCLVLLRGLLFATKVHKNSNSPKFPSSFVGVLTQYKKKG